jgi:hypothetical protein
MNSYQAKTYYWTAIISGYLLLALSGCSSNPKIQSHKPQYCHTSQTITTKNGDKVDSVTTVECTDDQVKRLFQSKSGMATNCGEFSYWIKIGNSDVQKKGISCQKPDGNWEVVNTAGF